MHNGTHPGTITTADTWLKDHIDGYLQWAKKNNSLLILTFDEGKDSGTNRIATIFVGPMVKHGQYNEKIDHYSLLRTVEDMFGLTHAGSSATATPITDCWKGKTEILKIAFRPQDSYAPGLSILNLVLTPRDRRFGINGFSYAGPVVFNLLGRTTISAYRDDAPGNTQLHAFPGGLSSGIYLMKSR
jgi:hypothetical protein